MVTRFIFRFSTRALTRAPTRASTRALAPLACLGPAPVEKVCTTRILGCANSFLQFWTSRYSSVPAEPAPEGVSYLLDAG